MNWSLIARGLRLSYLLRVPLLTFLFLVAFGPVALNSDLLANLLDQAADPWYLFVVSFSAFLLAFTAVTTLNLILYYGRYRFEGTVEEEMSQKRPVLVFLSGVIAAVVLCVEVYVRTIPERLVDIIPLTLGAVAAMALVFLSKVVQLALTDPKTTPHPPPFLVFPAYLIKPLEGVFDDLYCWSSNSSTAVKRFFGKLGDWPLAILRPAGQGYLVTLGPAPGEDLNLLSGHVFALSLFLLAFGSYLLIGWGKSHITDAPAKVPALAFVLLFGIVLCWALAALTFFFDRYRFPLLWVLLTLALITANSPQSDHFFRVERVHAALPEPPTPAAYLNARPKRNRLIFIATPGGGIQAAAWTTKVLQGLEGRPDGKDFRNSVALISSVSGGSLGSMIYGTSFTNYPNADIAKNAKASAIDEVAWGLTVPDVWRVILPWFRSNRAVDRGWALEKKWAAVNHLNDTGKSGTMFSDWAQTARQGNMPALIFNSMLVESGAPVVFSNTRFPATKEDNLHIRNFYDLCGDLRDHIQIRVNTAARLSASFPYVAPAARPNIDAPFGLGYHFVDGGYYDNFGINSLLAWIKESLDDESVRELLANPSESGAADILILQIQHFNPTALPGPSRAGWAMQLVAPGVAFYHMRDYAQNATAVNQLKLFAKYYETQGVHVWRTEINYHGEHKCAEAPLSWKLDQDQRQCVDDSWNYMSDSNRKALKCIDDYLAGRSPATSCENPAISSN